VSSPVQALARTVADSQSRMIGRAKGRLTMLRCKGMVDTVLAPINIRVTRFGRAVPPRPVSILKAVLLRSSCGPSLRPTLVGYLTRCF